MTQRSRFWDGTTIGDATEAPYNAPTEFAQVLASINGAAAYGGRGGVCRDELNMLEVTTSGGVSPISVNTGRAFVDGTWFESDAAVSFNITAPPITQSRYDLVVLRKSFSTQQVRLAIVEGIPGVVAVPPSPTQVAGVTWEVQLYQLLVAPGGASITPLDVRTYVPYTSFQHFTRLTDTTLGVAAAVVTIPVTTGYRMYMAVVNSKINTALHGPETLGLYFSPTTLTDYDWAVLQTYGTPPLSHSAPGLFSTWYIDVGNVGESSPYTTRYPQSVIFMTNLTQSLDKYTYTLATIGSANLGVAMQAGTFKYASPVTHVNFCIPAGDQFAVGSRFTLYGIY